MSNYGREDRHVGDVVVTNSGSICILTQLDVNRFPSPEIYDMGLDLLNIQAVKLTNRYRVVGSIREALKIVKEHGWDFSQPEPELTEAEKQAMYVQSLEARLAKLEAKS